MTESNCTALYILESLYILVFIVEKRKIEVKKCLHFQISKEKAEIDPFLERFTVTGRSFSAENEAPVYHFKDIFTVK